MILHESLTTVAEVAACGVPLCLSLRACAPTACSVGKFRSGEMYNFGGADMLHMPPQWGGPLTASKWRDDVRDHLIRVRLTSAAGVVRLRKAVVLRDHAKRPYLGRLVSQHAPSYGLRKYDRLLCGGALAALSDFDRLEEIARFPCFVFFFRPASALAGLPI